MNLADINPSLESSTTAVVEVDIDKAMQFRLRRIQAYNWGTFSAITDIPVAERGFLFVGKSGTGKSTLLDINAVLTTPPARRRLNVAAGGDRRDRDLATYVRGAYKRGKEDDNKTSLQYLRRGSTWSAIAQTYRNGRGQVVTLACVLWIKGASTLHRDVKYQYVVLERELDIKEFEFLQGIDFDVRKFKASMPEAFITDRFAAYAEHFRNLMGIESALALEILHRTQTTKNMDELPAFLRDFMLDVPETFDIAKNLVSEFVALDDAYKSVLTTREQIEVLRPAREAYDAYLGDRVLAEQYRAEQAALPVFRDQFKRRLLEDALDNLDRTRATLRLEREQAEATLGEAQGLLRILKDQRLAMGGSDVDRLEQDLKLANDERERRERRRRRLEDVCALLGLSIPDTPAAFVAMQAQAEQLQERLQAEFVERKAQRDDLKVRETQLEAEWKQIQDEIRSLESQSTNIGKEHLALRAWIAEGVGLDETDLPFAGELLDVKPDEAHWQGAIERVLEGFSTAMLVSDDDYERVAAFIDRTNLKRRLRYEHAVVPSPARGHSISARSLVHKLKVAEGPFRDFLRETLKERYNYECVDEISELRRLTKAVTRAGQVKRSRTSHIKDDRNDINNRRFWVLGSDNSAKKTVLNAEGQRAVSEFLAVRKEREQFDESETQVREQLTACSQLADYAWDDVDLESARQRYAALQEQLRAAQEASPSTAALDARIRDQEEATTRTQRAVNELDVKLQSIDNQQRDLGNLFSSLVDSLDGKEVPAHVEPGLKARLDALKLAPVLSNVDERFAGIDRQISADLNECNSRQADSKVKVCGQFTTFLSKWKLDGSDVDATLDSAEDFMAILERLETEGLHKFEARFRQLLQEQSEQNLVMLSRQLQDERNAISDRLDMINEALATAPFNPGTHLVIERSERRIEDVVRFQEMLKNAQAQMASAAGSDMETDERRFLVMKDLVSRLGSQDSADRNWQDLVLDVRKHFDFLARELDADGVEVDVYDSGEGKSGGQRTKLAATCLAAALSYQLRGRDGTKPRFAAVYMDEAFEKTDSEYTETLLKVFCEAFDLQMIMATPGRAVQTLSPYIGGAAVTAIRERKHSQVSLVEYNEETKELRLDKLAQELLVDEVD